MIIDFFIFGRKTINTNNIIVIVRFIVILRYWVVCKEYYLVFTRTSVKNSALSSERQFLSRYNENRRADLLLKLFMHFISTFN